MDKNNPFTNRRKLGAERLKNRLQRTQHWMENVDPMLRQAPDRDYSYVPSTPIINREPEEEEKDSFKWSDIANAFRMLSEKLVKGTASEHAEKMFELKRENEDLARVGNYYRLVGLWEQENQIYQDLLNNPKATKYQLQEVLNNINKLADEIKIEDNYFKGEGKSHPVISNLMFDINKNTEADDAANIAKAYMQNGIENPATQQSFWDAGGTVVNDVFQAVDNAINLVYDAATTGIDSLIGGDAWKKHKGYMTAEAIKTLPSDDPLVQKLYKGTNITKDTELQQRLENWSNYNNREFDAHNAKYQASLETLRTGTLKLKVPFIDSKSMKIDIWDPEDVPEEWRKNQEKYAGSLMHPIYSFPELGSTIGLAAGMVGSIASVGFGEYIARKLPTWVFGSGKMKMLKALSTAGKTTEAAMLANEYATVANSTPVLLGSTAAKAAGVTGSIAATRYSRELETAEEAADAISSRVLQEAKDGGADMFQVFGSIAKRAIDLGIDVSSMEPSDLIQLGLAYDVNTGDPVFEKAKHNATKGLNKLINANNALAVMDYLEIMPYLNYGNRVLSKFGNQVFMPGPRFTGAFSKTLEDGTRIEGKGLWGAIKDNWKYDRRLNQTLRDVEKTAKAGQTLSPLERMYANSMLGVYDGVVGDISKKFIKNDMPKIGATVLRGGKFTTGFFRKAIPTSMLESIEEGQQQILQQEYQRGNYDDYDKPQYQFPLKEIVYNGDLAKKSIEALFGLEGNDAKEIRKAMGIGFMTSMWVPGLMGATTNLRSNIYDNNIKNLVAQLKNDYVVSNLISNNFQDLHDSERAALFFDAFHKAGINNKRLHRSFLEFKSAIDPTHTLVEGRDIDEDVTLMNAAWSVYKNKSILEGMKNRNIKKYGTQHKEIVIQGARAIADAIKTSKRISENENGLSEILEKYNTVFDQLISDDTPQETKDKLIIDNPEAVVLVDNVKQLYEQYKTAYPLYKMQYILNKNVEEVLKDGRARAQAFRDLHLSEDEIKRLSKNELNNLIDNYIKQQMAEDPLESKPGLRRRAFLNAAVAPQLSFYEYAKRSFLEFNLVKNLEIATQLRDDLKQSKDVLKNRVQLLSGLDIDTEKIQGFITYLDDYVTNTEKEIEDSFGSLENSKRRFGKEELKQDNQEEYQKLYQAYLINQGLYKQQKVVAEAYIDPSSPTPTELQRAIFGNNNENYLQEDVEEYKKIMQQKNAEELDKVPDEVIEQDAKLAREKSSWKVIQADLDAAERRRRITHEARVEELTEGIDTSEAPQEQPQEEQQEEQPNNNEAQEEQLEREQQEGQQEEQQKEQEQNNEEEVTNEEQQEERKQTAVEKEQPTDADILEYAQHFNIEGSTTEILNEYLNDDKNILSLILSTQTQPISLENGMIVGFSDIFESIPIGQNKSVIPIKIIDKDKKYGSYLVISWVSGNRNEIYATVAIYAQNGYIYDSEASGFDYIADELDKYIDFKIDEEQAIVKIRPQLLDEFVYIGDNETGELDPNRLTEGVVLKFTDNNSIYEVDFGDGEVITKQGVEFGSNEEEQNPQPQTDEEKEIEKEQQAIQNQEQTETENKAEIQNKIDEYEQKLIEEEAAQQAANEIANEQLVQEVVEQNKIDEYEQQQEILAEIAEMYGAAQAMYEAPGRRTKQNAQSSDDVADFISSVFFYLPSDRKESSEIIKLKVNGKDVQLKYPRKPASQLAQKLIEPGWLNRCNKYYIVTQASNIVRNLGNEEDSYTVALVIEDNQDKTCYVATLKNLGHYTATIYDKDPVTGDIRYNGDGTPVTITMEVNRENELREWLMLRNTTKGDFPSLTKRFEYELLQQAKNVYEIVKPDDKHPNAPQDSQEYLQWVSRVKRWLYVDNYKKQDGQTEEEYVSKRLQFENLLSKMKEQARRSMVGKKRLLTQEEIEEQIQALRRNRNQIINAYLKKSNGKYVFPDTPRTDVKPESVEQSNGKFNEGDALHPIVQPDNVFGIPTDMQEIQKLISEGKLVIGIGKGNFDGQSDSFSIFDFRTDFNSVIYDGKGLAGKLYIFVSTPNGTKVPLMVSELKFNLQHQRGGDIFIGNENDRLELCIDQFTGELIDQDKIPSAAEVLLYLACGKLQNHFLTKNEELQQQFLDLFVNNGKSTLLKNSNKEAKLPMLAAKQFCVQNGILYIGMPVDNGYRLQSFAINTLFSGTEQANQDIRRIVRAIASQMHWNTDKGAMNTTFGQAGTEAIVKELEAYFRANKDKKTYSLFGIEELSFNKDDIFQTDEQGNILRVKPKISIASWMLATGKLLTDIKETIFRDPFVYANGVAGQNENVIQPEIKTGSLINPETPTQESNAIKDENKKENIRKKIRKSVFDQATDEQKIKEYKEAQKNTSIGKKHGEIVDIIALDLQERRGQEFNESELTDEIKAKANDLLSELNSQRKKDNKPEFSINDEDYTFSANMESVWKTSTNKNYSKYAMIPVLTMYEDGFCELHIHNFKNTQPIPITGYYQTKKTEGDINEKNVYDWLYKNLGISKPNVIISAVYNSYISPDVYGLTHVSVNTITDALQGNIWISKYAGRGTHYHEAWHYVNMLLHDKNTRKKLHDAYRATHKNLENATEREIEEEMAEDFRRYMEDRDVPGLTNYIKSKFKNFIDFITLSKNKRLYKKVYKAIASGKYANVKINRESALDVSQDYEYGIPSKMFIPTIPKSVIEKIKLITKSDDFYSVANAVADYIISETELNTLDDVRKLVSDKNKFKAIRDQVKYLADHSDASVSEMFMNFYNIPELLRYAIASRLKDLDIKIKEEDDATEKEDAPDNTWDKFTFTIPHKQNAATGAKLFLKQMPYSYFVTNQDGTRTAEKLLNPLSTLIPLFMPFDEVWNIVITNLASCRSWGEKENGEYRFDSLRGLVKEKAKQQSFFAILDQRLESIEDNTELKSQIVATLNAQIPNISFYEIQNTNASMPGLSLEEYDSMTEYQMSAYSKESKAFSIAGRNKRWVLRSDNTLKAVRAIPRRWSGQMMLSGLVDYKNDGYVISKAFSEQLDKYREEILNMQAVYKRKDITDSILDDIKEKALQILHYMGLVDIDIATLDRYIVYATNGSILNNRVEADTIFNMFKKQGGSFGYIISLIHNNVGNSEYKYANTKDGDKQKQLNRSYDISDTFNGLSLTSSVSILARAYNDIHPKSSDFAIRGPGGAMHYPASQHNYYSSKLSDINQTSGEEAMRLMRYPYARRSLILNAAKNFDEFVAEANKFQFNLSIGIDNKNTQDGEDYFGISSLDDYIEKLITLDQDPNYRTWDENYKNNEYTHLLMPTMADKKTYGSTSSKAIYTCHDCVVDRYFLSIDFYNEIYQRRNGGQIAESNIDAIKFFDSLSEKEKRQYHEEYLRTAKPNYKRFSNRTLEIFSNYFLDEIDALIQYYDKQNIKHFVDRPNDLISNYHGKVEDGKMDFSGNGGKFRYFYDIIHINNLNLNQYLEYLYKLEQQIIDGAVNIKDAKISDPLTLATIRDLDANADSVEDLDGFELIRSYLESMRNTYYEQGTDTAVEFANGKGIFDRINNYLIQMVEAELDEVCSDYNYKLGVKNGNLYEPISVPSQLLKRQFERFKHAGMITGNYTPYTKNSQITDSKMFYSLIANHVANMMISIMEYEKAIIGDPAMFEYKELDDSYSENAKIDVVLPSGKVVKQQIKVSKLEEKAKDKTKRFGSLLSPGDELRLDYSEEELEYDDEFGDGILRSKHYTNAVMQDIRIKSSYINSVLKPRFKRQLFVNYVIPNQSYILSIAGENYKNINDVINDIYDINSPLFDTLYSKIPKQIRDQIEQELQEQLNPFGKINVADAQVMIRPALYRKIRIGLGQWNMETDEVAYQILQKDASWMSDPVKRKLVMKLEIFPLKMSYYNHKSEAYADGLYINRQDLNKMAVFPLFKFNSNTNTANDLYERMNRPGQELDMISFVSAVKVGSPQNIPTMYTRGTDNFSVFTNELDRPSSRSLDYKTDTVENNTQEDAIPVYVQDLSKLRFQLNTRSHEASERAIGTQMFKILLSNIVDKFEYGRPGKSKRLGNDIKRDIMNCINTLTLIGCNEVTSRFYENGVINDKAVKDFILSIVKNNGLGSSAESIINSGYAAECLMSRLVFEQSVSKYVNENVVNINTQGGSAIQQSVFGFTRYGKENINEWNKQDYLEYNNGKVLEWVRKDNSMQVMLSINFFKNVIPSRLWGDFAKSRQWLINKNIIGNNAKPFGVGYRIPTQGMSSTFSFQVADILPENFGDVIVVPPEFTGQTGADFDVDKIYLATLSFDKNGNLITIWDDLFDIFVKYGFNYDYNKLSDKEKATIDKYADVLISKDHRSYLQEEYGDNPNWDAFKTSDFYKSIINDYRQEVRNPSRWKSAIGNRLIMNQMDVLQSDRNFAWSRGSIDVITNKISNDLLSWLQPKRNTYARGMYELLPSYQERTRLEFKIGKEGIGAFALNVTNLALTQYTHLTLDLPDAIKKYGFMDLDTLWGRDNRLVADWLSAMVNAHVDVAKDPYIFALNVNQFTYNHANFLLRSGMNISTFTFLAQPILKEYAGRASVYGGVYGTNIDGKQTKNESKTQIENKVKSQLSKEYIAKVDALIASGKVNKDLLQKHVANINALKYKYISSYENRKKVRSSNNGRAPQVNIPRESIFNYDDAKQSILNSQSKDPNKLFKSYMFQLCTMEAFNEINKYARLMSELVTVSQVDTKKFGNHITQMVNFIAKQNVCRYKNANNWKIKNSNIPNFASLDYYFKHTYLDLKLHSAIQFTKDILKNELLTCTDAFIDLFTTVSKEINGVDEYSVPVYRKNPSTGEEEPDFIIDAGGNKKYITEQRSTFVPYWNEDQVKAVTNAINSVARFNILMNQSENSQKMLSNTTMEYEPIDFSFGGDIHQVFPNVSRLLFGDNKQRSLPERIHSFIKYVLNNPDSVEAEGIVEDGVLINEFLKYLQPQSATKDRPFAVLSLNESQMRTGQYQKDRLISAWHDLLTHESLAVRQLARDIALYSYYSSYDTNTINSITDLIPEDFRILYDSSISQALRSSNKQLKQVISRFFQYDRGYLPSTSELSYIDIISRNYWYDNDIVKKVYEHGDNKVKHKSSYFEKRSPGVMIQEKSKVKFPGVIMTTNYLGNPAFVKMEKGGQSVLYKRVGRLFRQNKKGNQNINPCYIYMAVQKAGFHSKNSHTFELFKTPYIPSLFAKNMLPEEFNHDQLWDWVLQTVDDLNKEAAKLKYRYSIIQDDDVLPDGYSEKINQYVYKEVSQTSQNKISSVGPNHEISVIRLKKQKQLYDRVNSVVDNIISYGKEVPESAKEKTIVIPKDGILDGIFESMNDDRNHDIVFDISEDVLIPTQELIDGILDTIVDDYIQNNQDQSLNEEEIRSYYSQYARNVAMLINAQQYINNTISSMLMQGIKIGRIVGKGTDIVSQASMDVFVSRKEEFGIQSTNLFVVENKQNKEQVEQFFDSIRGIYDDYVETIKPFDDEVSEEIDSEEIVPTEEIEEQEEQEQEFDFFNLESSGEVDNSDIQKKSPESELKNEAEARIEDANKNKESNEFDLFNLESSGEVDSSDIKSNKC